MTLISNTIIRRHNFSRWILLLFLFIFSTHSFAIPDGVTIQSNGTTLKNVLEQLEIQSGMSVAYANNRINTQQIVSVDIQNKELDEALSLILEGRNLIYTIEGNKIIITQSAQQTVNQQRIYKGQVLDEIKEPVIGANVSIKNTQTGTITDLDGNFEIEAVPGAILVVSYIGYLPQEIKLDERTTLSINLYQNTEQLEEVVVVGYGVQRKRDVSTSISSLRASELVDVPVSSIEQALTGRMAGVQITQANGAPGAGFNIKVRGVGTITAGSSPLYVVDGVPLDDDASNAAGFEISPLSMINMNDVESIEVLKDASAAAIYGSRGSNGVVIITTKTGNTGKPIIKYDGFAGVQKITSKLDLLDAYEYADLVFEGHNAVYYTQLKNQGKLNLYNPNATNEERWANLGNVAQDITQTYLLPPAIMPYVNGVQGLTNTDWQDEVLRTGFIHKHNLSISGGNENVKYFISGNYQSDQGIVIESDYKKMGFRTKLDMNYGKWRIGGNINLNRSEYSLVNSEGRYADDGILSAAQGAAPIFPVYNDDGSFNFDQMVIEWGQSKFNNPVALATLIDDDLTAIQMLGTAYAQYDFTKELNFRTQGSWNYNNFVRDYYRPATLPNSTNSRPPSNPTAKSYTSTKYTWTWENTLNYNKQIGEHRIGGLAGWTVQKFKGNANMISATDLPQNDMLHTIPTTGTATSYYSTIDEWSLVSGLARAQYSFRDRYIFSAAVRADGSSRFGANNRWGYFPSVSGAWYVTEENFMNPVSSWLTNMKLRASWGITGNMSIGNYASYGIMEGQNYVLGGNTALGMREISYGNPDIGWEKTSQVNLGLELELFNWLNIEVDIYKGTTSDMLLEVPVLQYSGFSTVLQNIGKLSNKGIELTLSTSHRIGEVQWTNSLNYAANRNKVLSLGDGATEMITQSSGVIDFITKVGEPIGNYYTYVVDGVYQNQAEIDRDVANGLIVPNAQPGDFRFKKFGDDDTIDANDKAITGNYMPDFTYGYSTTLKYRSFDFSLALQGVYGNEIANINRRYLLNMEGNANQHGLVRERWRSEAEPGNGSLYRANRSSTGMNSVISTHHIEDGSYMRIREITLGYALPKKLVSRIGINALRVYGSAFNPFTFTNYSGYNPEVSTDASPIMQGVDYGTYPLSKSFVFGLNLTL